MTAWGPHKGLRCGDCERVYPLPVLPEGAKRPRVVCPPCDSVTTLTVKAPTVTAGEMFRLWDEHRTADLERLMKPSPSEVSR